MLPDLDIDALLDLCAGTQIGQHDGGHRAPWVLTPEQREMLEAGLQHRYVYVAKGRQVGASTAYCAMDAAWTLVCDSAGHRVVTAIVVDTHEKVKERIYVCGDMLRQWGAVCDVMVDEIRFPNGSRIVGLTAGGNEVGASLTLHRLHLTELPYWQNPTIAYGALMQALVLEGRCVIETTLDVIEPLAKDLWQKPNAYHKLFYNVESHHEYRHNPGYITDAQWVALQGEGYTDRSAAAWFQWKVDNHFGGDRIGAFKKFPQLERHMFASAEGRWVSVTSRIVAPSSEIQVLAPDGTTWTAEVWGTLAESSGDVTIGVDTSAGLGRDRSVITVRDKADGRILCMFSSSLVPTDTLGYVLRGIVDAYRATTTDAWNKPVLMAQPLVLVEDNGIGQATCLSARRAGVQVTPITTTAESQYRGMLAARREIEQGRAYGPALLAEECDSCHVHVSRVADERGVGSPDFRGRKDALMCLGFLALEAERTPHVTRLPPVETRRIVDGKAIMRARGLLRTGGWG